MDQTGVRCGGERCRGFDGSRPRELVKCVGLKPPGLALPAALSLAAQPRCLLPPRSRVRPRTARSLAPFLRHSHRLWSMSFPSLIHTAASIFLKKIRSHHLQLLKLLRRLSTASGLKFGAVASPPSSLPPAIAVTRGDELQLHRLELRTGP